MPESKAKIMRHCIVCGKPFLAKYLEGRERQGIMRNNEDDCCDLQGVEDFNTLVGGIWK